MVTGQSGTPSATKPFFDVSVRRAREFARKQARDRDHEKIRFLEQKLHEWETWWANSGFWVSNSPVKSAPYTPVPGTTGADAVPLTPPKAQKLAKHSSLEAPKEKSGEDAHPKDDTPTANAPAGEEAKQALKSQLEDVPAGLTAKLDKPTAISVQLKEKSKQKEAELAALAKIGHPGHWRVQASQNQTVKEVVDIPQFQPFEEIMSVPQSSAQEQIKPATDGSAAPAGEEAKQAKLSQLKNVLARLTTKTDSQSAFERTKQAEAASYDVGKGQPRLTFIAHLREHFGREFMVRCDYCSQSFDHDDGAWLCTTCNSCLVHSESFARCKDNHFAEHAKVCSEIKRGIYLGENLEAAEKRSQQWIAEQVKKERASRSN